MDQFSDMDSSKIDIAKKKEKTMSRSIILPNSKDCNSKSLISRFSSLVTAQYIGISARALGFIKRRNNLNPSKLVQALIMTAGESCNIKIASVKERYSSLTRSG